MYELREAMTITLLVVILANAAHSILKMAFTNGKLNFYFSLMGNKLYYKQLFNLI